MKTSRRIENTIAVRKTDVVTRKWYREGYFVEKWGNYGRFNSWKRATACVRLFTCNLP